MEDKRMLNELLEQIIQNHEHIINTEITQFKEPESHETVITFTIDRNNKEHKKGDN